MGNPIHRAGNTLSVFKKDYSAGRWLLYRDANMLTTTVSSHS